MGCPCWYCMRSWNVLGMAPGNGPPASCAGDGLRARLADGGLFQPAVSLIPDMIELDRCVLACGAAPCWWRAFCSLSFPCASDPGAAPLSALLRGVFGVRRAATVVVCVCVCVYLIAAKKGGQG